MDRHIWLTIKDNETTTDGEGLYWPDVMTLPINRFKYTQPPEIYTINEFYVNRLDLLMYDYYGVNYYDDIILWLNNIEYKQDLVSGQKILLPTKDDLETFYLRYLV